MILIFGKGWLGTKLAAALADTGPVCHTAAHVDDWIEVRSVLDEYHPDVVINAAGKNGHPNVDWCEAHPIETARSNTMGPIVLADECDRYGARLIHLGSGCVYHGAGHWFEGAPAHPASVYAQSKYAADLVLQRLPNVTIVRLRMPFDCEPHPRNLITKLASYPRVINTLNSLTSVTDLMLVIRALVALPHAGGIFHAVNPGSASHSDIIELYREIVDESHQCQWIHEHELYALGLASAPRSAAVIENVRLPALGINMRPVRIALREDLERYRACL